MRIVVCVKQTALGELNPFDACAYEAALRINGAEIILLSMAPRAVEGFLQQLTRLGAGRAVLLTDHAFSGADTLATAYTLSLAVKKLSPDLVICGRQTVDGDTGQTGPALAVLAELNLITNVMGIEKTNGGITCKVRDGNSVSAAYPALITVERINTLRLPSIRSKAVQPELWDAAALNADISRCGLTGSPTRVLKTYENKQDRRCCRFIEPSMLMAAINEGTGKERRAAEKAADSGRHLSNVWIIGESPRCMAETVSRDIRLIEPDTPERIAEKALAEAPQVIFWGSDPWSKRTAPQVAAILKTGLCADCTSLETDGSELFMYRPAFSGNVIAKIKCSTRPAMATVRTVQPEQSNIIVGIGAGAKACIEAVEKFAGSIGADIVASRKMVDGDCYPYEKLVGLTGRTVNPDVYIAAGISGAVHHIAGIRQSGTIIAVNPDRNADIFKYSDFGIVAKIEDVLKQEIQK